MKDKAYEILDKYIIAYEHTEECYKEILSLFTESLPKEKYCSCTELDPPCTCVEDSEYNQCLKDIRERFNA